MGTHRALQRQEQLLQSSSWAECFPLKDALFPPSLESTVSGTPLFQRKGEFASRGFWLSESLPLTPAH